MKRIGMATAAFGMVLSALSAQDIPGDKDQQRDTASWPSEVRVYVFERDKKAFDDKEATATLILEDKTPGAAPVQKKMIPMPWVAPRAGDKQDIGYHGQIRNVEGTNYVVEFVALKTTTPRFPDREPRFREQGYKKEGDTFKQKDESQPGAQDKDKRPGEKVDDEWFRWHKHDAGYFKADLTKEQMPAGAKDFTASVQFNFRGEAKTVSGFTFGDALGRAGEKHDVWGRLSEDMMMVERCVNAHDMDKARATVDRNIQDLEKSSAGATGDAKKGFDDCLKDFRDLQTAIHNGNRDKAMAAVKKCREKCDERKASTDETQTPSEKVK